MRRPRPAGQQGFTLIELLVALAILTMAATLLSAAISGAWFVARDSGAEAGDADVSGAQRILRARLERLAPVTRDDSTVPIIDAGGDTHIFSFVAPPLDRLGPDALQRFRLLLSPAGDLMLYTANALEDRIDLRDRSLAGWRPTRLVSGVGDLEIMYFGADRMSGAKRWQAFWLDRTRVPELVRVRLRFAPNDVRQWPDLIVRPRAATTAPCRFTTVGGDCGTA